MTEDEAKTKWCPFARVVAASHTNRSDARNRVVETAPSGEVENVLIASLAGAQCIGSACMAWRWKDAARETAQTETRRGDPPAPKGEGWAPRETKFRDGTGSSTWYRNWSRPRLHRRGFCGLAGAPA